MLDKQTFLQSINYLNKYYRKFEFDVKDDMLISVWYSKFKLMDDLTYKLVVKNYCESNKFPPNSPSDLMEAYTNLLVSKEQKPIEVWEKVHNLIIEYGFYYNREKIYKALGNNDVLIQTVREFEHNLINYSSSDTSIPKQFQKAYSENLRARKQNEIELAIEHKQTLRIEGK